MKDSTLKQLSLVGTSKLSAAVAQLLDQSAAISFEDLTISGNQIICWLPKVADPVDEQVQDLVDMIDQAHNQPEKIVVWSPAGTADDAQPDQLQQWWGPEWRNIIAAYLYMVKMIDELEYPYTVVRSLPVTAAGPAGKLVAEGKSMTGQTVSLESVADAVVAACRGKYTNESIGVDADI